MHLVNGCWYQHHWHYDIRCAIFAYHQGCSLIWQRGFEFQRVNVFHQLETINRHISNLKIAWSILNSSLVSDKADEYLIFKQHNYAATTNVLFIKSILNYHLQKLAWISTNISILVSSSHVSQFYIIPVYAWPFGLYPPYYDLLEYWLLA